MQQLSGKLPMRRGCRLGLGLLARRSTLCRPSTSWSSISSTTTGTTRFVAAKKQIRSASSATQSTGRAQNGVVQQPDHQQQIFWSTTRVLALVLASSAAAYGFASMRSPVVAAVDDARDYSRIDKYPTPQYGTVEDLEKAIKEIELVVSEDAVSIDDDVLKSHGFSEWSHCNPDSLPVAVCYPKNTKDVSEIAKICHKFRIPIIPFSGGSSLEGNFTAPHGGISVDFAYMDKILQFNKDDMDVVVQPSVPWMSLNEQIADSRLFFPVDPGPSAQIGGMVGTNCSGTNAVRYGTMKDWVINLTVVLADGTILKTKRRPRKTSAGYNLNSLFVGSEGTLGLVTEITLKLAIVPETYSVAVVDFPTIRDAAAAAAGVIKTGVPVACLELMDDVQMRVVNMSGATKPLVWKEAPHLFLKFSGTKAGVEENIERVKAISKANKGGEFRFAKSAAEQKMLWSARKESLWSMLAQRKGNQEVWSTDVAVPVSRLADIIEISKRELDSLGLFASILGHVGDGNFHESIMYDKTVPGEFARVQACVQNMVDRALDMEGTCTGEHGIGLGKKGSLLKEVGVETVGVMKAIKLSLDPYWLMNPGKIMDVPGTA